MSCHQIWNMYLCRGALVALVVLSVVVACGRAESPDPPARVTGMATPAVSATSLPQEAPEKVLAMSVVAERPHSQRTALPTGERIPRQSTVEFHSDKVGDWYNVYVSLPKGYDPQHPGRYPVIYLLDADWYHDGSSTMIGDGGVAGIASALSEGGRIPCVSHRGAGSLCRW